MVLFRDLEKRIRKLEKVQRPEEYQNIPDPKNLDPLPAPKMRSEIRRILEQESRRKNS